MFLSQGIVVIFIILLSPLYLYIIMSFLGKPRRPKVALLYLAIPVLFIAFSAIGMYFGGVFLQILFSLLTGS